MPEQDITQIRLGKFQVGITGLKAAIEEVMGLGDLSDEELAQALYERLQPLNYIPASAVASYKQAFVREFKKARGEKVAEESQGTVIKILGPGCPNCHRLEQLVYEVLTELNLPAQVELVKDLEAIAAHGVFGTPALIINQQLKALGKVPSRETLKEWLSELNP